MDPIAVLVLTFSFVAFLVVIIMLSKTQKVDPLVEVIEEGEEQLDFMGHMNAGNKAFSQYNFHEALYHFQQAGRLKPEDSSIHFKIGRILVQQENYSSAVDAFNQVIRLTPDKVEAYFELARTYKMMNKLKDAHKALKLALKFDPNHEDALKLKVSLLKLEKQDGAALNTVQSLYQMHPDNADYTEQYAELLEKSGELEQAIQVYTNFIQQGGSDIGYYQGKVGLLLVRADRYEEAKDYLERVLNSATPDSDGTVKVDSKVKDALAVCLCNLGAQYQNQGSLPKAIEYYQQALQYDDTNEDVYFNLGKAFISQNQVTEALEYFHRALSLCPSDAEVCYELGKAYDAKGDLQEAGRFYDKCLSINPKYAPAYFGLGTLCGVQGDIDKSVKFLTEAIKMDPAHVDSIYNLAVCQEQLGKKKKALQLYKKVLELNPAHTEAKSNLSHLQKELG